MPHYLPFDWKMQSPGRSHHDDSKNVRAKPGQSRGAPGEEGGEGEGDGGGEGRRTPPVLPDQMPPPLLELCASFSAFS